jgi:hypothetical protein
MPYRHSARPPLYEYIFECGRGNAVQEFSVTARDDDEALDRAVAEAALLGLHDVPLRCVDYYEHDPSGGDGDED